MEFGGSMTMFKVKMEMSGSVAKFSDKLILR
nr:hypothetical protein LGRDSM20601_p0046 [Listeria grayi]